MTALAAIRTYRWTDEEERLFDTLRPVFGDDVAVVFHDRPEDVIPPLRIVDVTRDRLTGMGLGVPTDWGWRCGDYFYYALRDAVPGYDHYWLIEPDVVFTGDASEFFAQFADDPADVLGAAPSEIPADQHAFRDTMGHLTQYRALFALTRLSGRAIDTLLDVRRENSQIPVRPMGFANDEIFVFSNAYADPELTVGDLVAGAPGWLGAGTFRTNPDMLVDQVLAEPSLANKILHPVRSKASYKEALADRLSNKTAFLRRMGSELGYLTPQDIDDIAEKAHANIRAALRQNRPKD